jgi:hypothetical protein
MKRAVLRLISEERSIPRSGMEFERVTESGACLQPKGAFQEIRG